MTNGPSRGASMPLTRLLAGAIVSAYDHDLAPEHYAAVRRILIDWLGVAIAGSAEPVSRIMQAEFGGEQGPASILGTVGKASAADAALVNGTAGHALDYDDVQEFVGHPGAVVVPAALAVAEALNSTPEQIVRAIVAGYDAARFVGTLAMPGHYDHGFHSTATICTFGAAAASAVLMRLGPQEVEHAIGLAATQAAGLKSMFGTMAKPFHAGRAASAGIVAARLAARGMTANTASLEAGQGFLATQANQPVPDDWKHTGFGESLPHLLFKYHASCYLTHSTIEAVRSLMRSHDFGPVDVAEVVVQVPAGHLKVCNIEEPDTGLEAKFSLRQVTALALCGHDTADIDVFCDRLARDADVRKARAKVQIRVQGDPGGLFGATVAIRLVDGRSLSAASDVSATGGSFAETDEALDRKFAALVGRSIGAEGAEQMLQSSYQFQTRGLRGLMAPACY